MRATLTEAQWSLVATNRRLIYFVLTRLALGREHDPEDMASIGLLGLVNAARCHDPARGAFTTIACISIRRAILDEVTRRHRPPAVSLDLPAGEQRGPISELIPAPEPGLTAEGRLDLDRLLAHLPRRSRAIVRLRFGLGGDPPLDLRRVGIRVGLSKQRVAQILAGAMKRMRAAAGSETHAGQYAKP